MRVCHGFAATFDDPNLVSCAGLAPVLGLAERAGLQRLSGEHVRIDKPGGRFAGVKVSALVAGMVAGAGRSGSKRLGQPLTRRAIARSKNGIVRRPPVDLAMAISRGATAGATFGATADAKVPTCLRLIQGHGRSPRRALRHC